jgi:hypothetical protein
MATSKLKPVTTWTKNVAKSFGYALGDTFKDYNPVISSLLSDSKKCFLSGFW